jgi:FkbM family methyltransferase
MGNGKWQMGKSMGAPPMRHALKAIASLMHHGAARNERLAVHYVKMFRLLKHVPDGGWKGFILNSLQSVAWPPLDLPLSRVRLTPEIEVAVVPHLGEFDFAAHIYRRLTYERETVSWFVGRSYDTVVEIGANVGFYTLLFSKLFPEASIYAFEPSRTAYRRLLENVAANDCANVLPFNCAVTGAGGFVDFYEPAGHLTNGSLHHSFARRFASDVRATRVPSVSGGAIQDLCRGARRLLLKIDVEGSEPAVVSALQQIIRRSLPDMVIEVLPGVADDLNKLDCLHGYRLLQLTAEGALERPAFGGRFDCRDYALVPL